MEIGLNFIRTRAKVLTDKFISDEYLFLDTQDFEVAKILKKYDIHMREITSMENNDDDFMLLVQGRAFTKDRELFETEIFPQLDKVLLIKYGTRYRRMRQIFRGILEKTGIDTEQLEVLGEP